MSRPILSTHHVRAVRPRPRSSIIVLIGAALVAILVSVIWLLPSLLTRHPSNGMDARAILGAENAVRGTLVQALAAMALAGGLFFTARTYQLGREGQITDRYANAIQQIGSANRDVRIGGIYALERVAHDSQRDHRTVIEVLGTFIRERTMPPDDPIATERPERQADVQAALTVLGRRRHEFDVNPLDLHGADLRYYDLRGAWFGPANLIDTILDGADMSDAVLIGAQLVQASLRESRLERARLDSANLSHANLTGAILVLATLNNADLSETQADGAQFGTASMISVIAVGANLANASLGLTNLRGSDLSGSSLVGANLTGANLTEARLLGVKIDAKTLVGADFNRAIIQAIGDHTAE